MENAHERRWPPGLQTLETRQMNRRLLLSPTSTSPGFYPLLLTFIPHTLKTFPQAIRAVYSTKDTWKAGGGGDGLRQHPHQWRHDPRTWNRDDLCPRHRVVVIICGSNQNLQWILDGFQNKIHNNWKKSLWSMPENWSHWWMGMSVETVDCSGDQIKRLK